MSPSSDKKSGGSGGGPLSFYDQLRYNVVPPVFLVVFTLLTQALVRIGNPETEASWINLGSAFSWKVVGVFYLWAFLSLQVSSKEFKGPKSPEGVVPVYSANGTQYYLFSLVAYAVLLYFCPWLPLAIYDEMSFIISCLNISALVLCFVLMTQGLGQLDDSDPAKGLPRPYLFYRGIHLHPRWFGVDIKQWTNCRVGMLGWALLVLTFAVACVQKNPSSAWAGSVVNAFLINIYLLKFFYWETGYFNTLDITLDRAGYYLCWGCLVWVQIFYTFSAYHLVAHPSSSSVLEAGSILAFGLVSLFLNYAVDRQKENFRLTGGKCHVWGKPAKFLAVEYVDENGKSRKSRLLLSGFWGVSRHLNYVFELSLALSWSLPGARHGVAPFFYFLFLMILLVHRIFRDEEKCSAKYGKGWDEYCSIVRYRLIPGIF